MNDQLFAFIKAAPTAYHTTAECARRLAAAGYTELAEEKNFELQPGGRYFTTRNGSSLVAFRVPEADFTGFMIAAVHGDSPAFKLRGSPTLQGGAYLRLSVEKYGGMILSSWLDRPLSVAGRVTLKTENGFAVKNVDFGVPFLIIPSVAIHMTRGSDGKPLDPATDLIPLAGTKGGAPAFEERLSAAAGVPAADILSADLFLYNPADGMRFGDLIAAPRLDDLQAVFGCLTAFLAEGKGPAMPVFALFDNEEVGSSTKQGAASTFLADVLRRVLTSLWMDDAEYRRKLATSLMLSCDNAHAVHPNHPELADRVDAPVLGGGIVLKQNANQRYTTDAVSGALVRLICDEAGVPLQTYSNRPDIPGGSTLGNIANTQVSLNTADIGLPQLAMHSAYETAGATDTEYLVRALEVFFARGIAKNGGIYTLKK